MTIRLYSYWRSSAAYRVRLALSLKGLEFETVPVSLLPGESEHRQDEYRERNPQMLVPFLEDGDLGTAQSLAILEYLEEAYPEPALLPSSVSARAAVRSFCDSICCDVHPLNNLRVLVYLRQAFGVTDEQRDTWYAHWIHESFRAAEITADKHGGPFAFGDTVTLADTCLIPQMYNARRFNVPLDDYPNLTAIETHCNGLPAFQAAIPENQPDASA